MRATTLRCLALAAVLLWLLALPAPVRAIAIAIRGFHFAASDSGEGYGYNLALMGWLGPLGLSIAWYANIPFMIGLSQMMRGRPPASQLWRVTVCVAATSLLPHLFVSATWGLILVFHWGPALWLWLAAFSMLAIPDLCASHPLARARLLPTQSETPN